MTTDGVIFPVVVLGGLTTVCAIECAGKVKNKIYPEIEEDSNNESGAIRDLRGTEPGAIRDSMGA